MKYYPAYLDLSGKRCCVVGGGGVGERKTLTLLKAGANITVISPELTDTLDVLKKQHKFIHIEKTYETGDVKDCFLVIAATSDEEVNEKVAKDAPALVNVVNIPAMSNFIVPSSVSRGDLILSVSTSGVSPALSKSIRKELEELYPETIADYLNLLKTLRNKIQSLNIDRDRREDFLKKAADKDTLPSIRQGCLDEIMERLNAAFDALINEV
ncbi:siroheme synthase [Candidatus Magnetoovum chiemensis]|nr:siroheme synthase [Candidatus Magnetoovum chiemensis]